MDDRGLTQTEVGEESWALASRTFLACYAETAVSLGGDLSVRSGIARCAIVARNNRYDVDIVVREKGRRKARDTIHLPSSYAS